MTSDKKITNFAVEAINKMMEIAGHSERFEDLKSIENWYVKFTMTSDEDAEWKDWFFKEVKKRFRWSKKMIQKEYMWFHLSYSLRIDDNKYSPEK